MTPCSLPLYCQRVNSICSENLSKYLLFVESWLRKSAFVLFRRWRCASCVSPVRLKAVQKLFDYVLVDVQPSRSQICLSAVGAADFILIPAEAGTKGVNSLIDTLEFLQEQAKVMAFTGKVLGVIPFRDRWIGRTQTLESKENIEAMKQFAGDIPVLPSIRESEQFKRAIRNGQLLSEIGQLDLQYPFEKIIQALTHEQ